MRPLINLKSIIKSINQSINQLKNNQSIQIKSTHQSIDQINASVDRWIESNNQSINRWITTTRTRDQKSRYDHCVVVKGTNLFFRMPNIEDRRELQKRWGLFHPFFIVVGRLEEELVFRCVDDVGLLRVGLAHFLPLVETENFTGESTNKSLECPFFVNG